MTFYNNDSSVAHCCYKKDKLYSKCIKYMKTCKAIGNTFFINARKDYEMM